jgi:hypothetical protein
VNFKIRVIDNIGFRSVETFGCIGTVINVVDGFIHDLRGHRWLKPHALSQYRNVEEINKAFTSPVPMWFNTEFELVEDNP